MGRGAGRRLGKGADAAGVTALARYTVRAVANGRRPGAVLRELNDALLREGLDERFCTAAYALLRPTTHGASVQLCSGGHPPALVVRRDGRVEQIDAPGMVLGFVPNPPLAEVELDLASGDKLVLYTDGVTEARVDARMLGVSGLADALSDAAPDDAVRIGERIYAATRAGLEGRPDDIAILAIRAAARDDVPRGNEGLARTGASGRSGALRLRLLADAAAPEAACRALDGLRIPILGPADADRARLLVSEVVHHSVEQSDRGPTGWIAFHAQVTPYRFSVEVCNERPSSPHQHRDAVRHPLTRIDELADRCGTSDDGRCVWCELDAAD